MMKFLFIPSLVLFASFLAPAQSGQGTMQKQLDDLKARIKLLEKEQDDLIAKDKSSDSAIYCSIRSELLLAFTEATLLESEFRNTCEKIAISGLFTKLMQASNPTSDILGFRFTDIIFTAAERHFLDKIKDDQDKKRFSQVVSKIIDNPVVTSLANTNPVTSVVASIISTIAGFSTSRVDIEKEGGKIKDVSVSQQDIIDNKSITAFREELQAYINFYDALITASNEYLQGIDNIKDKYAYLVGSLNDYRDDLFTELNISGNNLLVELTVILPDPSRNDLDYSMLLNDPKIRKCMAISGKLPALKLEVNKLISEYKLLLIKYLSDYTNVLESAEGFPEKDIDKTKTEKLVNEIKSFENNLENGEWMK
jgi:hypothetical protein